jgi:hypothetical protein
MEAEIDRKQLEKIMFELIDGECNYCGKKIKKENIFALKNAKLNIEH